MSDARPRCTCHARFRDATAAYRRAEPRWFCYSEATRLIRAARSAAPDSWWSRKETVHGILLLLYCWNFATPKTKSLTPSNIRAVLLRNSKRLRSLERVSLTRIERAAKKTIPKVFDEFSECVGQTGASKALSLLNPELFVMWDTAIRRNLSQHCTPHINDGRLGREYLTFLEGLSRCAKQHGLQSRLKDGACLAKKLDEFHYLQFSRS